MIENSSRFYQIHDKLLFFLKFMKSPKQIGSITPSSSALTRGMLEPINWTGSKTVVELGAGTGVFTRAIQKRRNKQGNFILFEKDNGLRQRLKEQHADVSCYEDASELTKALHAEGIDQADYIISGLPFANFSEEKRDKIISEVCNSLHDDGLFITFQYSLQMKRLLKQRFSQVSVKLVVGNIPPAFVYVCKK